MARTFALELALNLKQFRDGMREVATGLANGVKAGAAGLASSLKPAADGVREIGAAAKEAQVAMLALSGAAAMGLRSMIRHAAEDETAARRFAAAFGSAAKESQKFAESLAEASRRGVGEIQGLMSEFQDFAVAQGAAREDAAKLSQDLTARAVDLAGYYGRDVKEVMGALQQAMVGAGRSARVFGVDMDDTAIKAKALSMGFDPSTLQPWQEAMIRSNLILDQTKDKAGQAGAQAGTFTEEWRAMAVQFGELLSDLGTPVVDALKPVMIELGNIIEGFRDWINEHPALKTALGLVTAGTLAFVGACALAATILSPLWSLLKAGYTILATYATQLHATATAQTQFTLTTRANSLAVTRLGVAVGIVAAAYAGWQIGRQIDEMIGLTEATDRLSKSTGDAADAAKSGAAFALAGPVGWIRAGFYAKAIGESLHYLEEQKKHTAEINALADARIAKMTEEQRAMAKQLEAWGATHIQASILAGDERQLLKWLEAQVKAGKGNADILEKIEQLRRRNAKALAEEAGAMDRNKSAAQKLQEAKERLKKGEEEFLKAVQEIGDDVLRAREGDAAAEISTLRRQLEDRRKLLERNATDELAVLRDLERQKTALQAQGVSTDKDRAELKGLEEAYRKHAANLNTARQAILNAEEAYHLKLRSIYAKRFEDLRAEQKKELQETRENTRAMLDAYESGINAIDAKLNAIRTKRDQGSEATRSFIEQLQRDKLAAHDSAQAEIEDLKRTAAANLLTAQSEAQRAQVMELTLEKARRVADATQDIAEAEQAVQAARERTADARESGSAAGYASALDEQRRKEQELAALREKAIERQKQLTDLQQHMQDIAEMSRQEAAEADAQEAQLKDQRVLLEEEIASVKRDQELTVQAILDKYHEMELSLSRQLGLEQQIVQARGGARAGETPAADAQAGQAPSANEAGVAVAEATSAAQQSAAAAKAVQTATAQAATAATTLAQTIQTQLEPLRADLASFIQWAGTFAADLSKLMPQVLQSIGMVLEEQRAFGASLMQFGNVTLEKLTEAQTAFALHRSELDSLSAEIGALKLLEAARGDSNLGAQGY